MESPVHPGFRFFSAMNGAMLCVCVAVSGSGHVRVLGIIRRSCSVN